jgi:hypothetical protein
MAAMTESEVILKVLAAVDPLCGGLSIVRRGGRTFMAIPGRRDAALRVLRLYQPQRPLARGVAGILRWTATAGLHECLLRGMAGPGETAAIRPSMPGVRSGSCGIMLGNPSHLIPRAIASFETEDGWQIAKIAFGERGKSAIDQEAGVLSRLPAGYPGIPRVLGLHRGQDFHLLRMPYYVGRTISPDESRVAVSLLDAWVSDAPRKPFVEYAESLAISATLAVHPDGAGRLEQLLACRLAPCLRHGDYARWNLVATGNEGLLALDWEWGAVEGMPGLDLAHFFAQDARLVQRLEPSDVVRSVLCSLSTPECVRYLEKTGWQGDPRLPLLASLALTYGTCQQANGPVLGALLRNWRDPALVKQRPAVRTRRNHS